VTPGRPERTQLIHALLADSAHDAAPAGPPRWSFSQLDREKVAPQALTLPNAPEDGPQRLEAIASKRAILEHELALVSAALDEIGVEFCVLRGFAVQAVYPAGVRRQFNDVDICLRDGTYVPRALTTLAANGYYVARPLVARRGRGATWLGIALNKRVPSLQEPLYLDLVVGGPGVTPLHAWTLSAQAWEGIVDARVAGATVPLLAPTPSLAACIVELHEREDLLARDYIDLELLRRAGASFERAAAELSGLPLDRELALARRGAAEHELPDLAQALASMPSLRQPPSRSRRALDPRRGSAVAYGVVRVVTQLLERRFPRVALALARHTPSGLAFRLGVPVYLVRAAEPRPPRAPIVPGFAARLRPLLDEDELAAAFPHTLTSPFPA
jgi:hypothetical protein